MSSELLTAQPGPSGAPLSSIHGDDFGVFGLGRTDAQRLGELQRADFLVYRFKPLPLAMSVNSVTRQRVHHDGVVAEPQERFRDRVQRVEKRTTDILVMLQTRDGEH